MAASPTKTPVVTDHCPRCETKIAAGAGDCNCSGCSLPLRVFQAGNELQVFGKEAFARVIAILADSFSVPADQILPQMSFDDLGADSLDVVELTMKLEEEFDITLPSEEENSIGTVGDVIRVVDRCLAKKKG